MSCNDEKLFLFSILVCFATDNLVCSRETTPYSVDDGVYFVTNDERMTRQRVTVVVFLGRYLARFHLLIVGFFYT